MHTTHHKSSGGTSKVGQITAILQGADLEAAWEECLNAWEDSDPSQKAECRAFVDNQRDNFVHILRDVDDPDEQETVTCLFYTQVKSQWILINTQSGYQISNGRIEGALICKAGMLSALLGSLEPALRKTNLSRITNFLAEPEVIPPGAPDVEQLSALLGVDVVYESPSSDGGTYSRIVVDAREIETRFRELLAKLEDRERQWNDLQNELGKTGAREIIAHVHLLETRSESFNKGSELLGEMG